VIYDGYMKKFIVLLVIVIGSACIWYQYSLLPVNAESEIRLTVNVPSGSSVTAIADILEGKGVIRSSRAFRIFLAFHYPDAVFQAGAFVMQPSQTIDEVVDVLSTGLGHEMIVTIPDGFTVKEIDVLLTEKKLIAAGDLTKCASICDFSSFEFLPFAKKSSLAARGGLIEGYLYPDTYFVVADDFEPKFFLERLLFTFRKRVLDRFVSDIEQSGRSLHEIVTMASLIEKETRTNEERRMVAGILWKRFDVGRGLDVDAANRYILEKRTSPLTGTNLNDSSPYNTRKFRGLPPGPIASPGIKSIEAALHPEVSEYWYYLHGKDGKIRYAITNEDHNINKYKYLR